MRDRMQSQKVNSRGVSRRNLLGASSSAGLAALVAAACGGGSSSESTGSAENPSAGAAIATTDNPERGGRVRIGVQAEPTNLDPQVGTGGSDHTFVWSMYENLVTYDDKFNPAPQLAEK